MSEKILSAKIICKGGLSSNENSLDLSENEPGAATRLVNYEPSLFGGYRRINGFVKFDTNFPTVGGSQAEGKVLGLVGFKNSQTQAYTIIAVRKNATDGNYSFYYHTQGIGWTKYANVPVRPMTLNGRTVQKIRNTKFNFGDGNRIVFVDGVNPALVFDGTNWDEIKTTNSGANRQNAGGPLALNAPTVVETFKNHLFLGSDPSYLATIAHSAPNNPYDFASGNGAGQISLGFEAVNFKPFRENLFVFGENDIKKVIVTTVSGKPDFSLENVTSNVGCIARDSIVEIGGDLLFLSPDGFRPVAGTSRIGDVELETVSKSVQSLVRDYSEDHNLDNLNSLVIRSKSQVRFFYSGNEIITDSARGLIGGLRLGSNSQIVWEFGELLGIRASCTMSEYIDRNEIILHGDYNGMVYRQEVGNSFDEQDILSIYSSPYLDIEKTEVNKTFYKVNTHIRPEGPVELNLSAKYDWGDVRTSAPSSYAEGIGGGPVVYAGEGVDYGAPNIIYGGGTKPIIETDIQGSGYSIRLTYVSNGKFTPHSIQGFILEFSEGGNK